MFHPNISIAIVNVTSDYGCQRNTKFITYVNFFRFKVKTINKFSEIFWSVILT